MPSNKNVLNKYLNGELTTEEFIIEIGRMDIGTGPLTAYEAALTKIDRLEKTLIRGRDD